MTRAGLRAEVTGDPALLAAAAELRREVFVDEQGVDPAIERDGADPTAVHVVAVEESGSVVGTGRLVDAGDHARLGRIAVRRDRRGRGIGAAVVRALEDSAACAGLPLIRLHAQAPVVQFYRILQYDEDGPPDVEAGLAHQWMRRHLLPGLRPARDSDAAALRELVGGCYAEYPGCVLDPEGVDAWLAEPASHFARARGGLWVLDPVVGCVGWRPAGERGVELKALYVARPARRHGYGRALVGLVERTARERRARRVELWSDTRFTDAHRLYARSGFRREPGERALGDPSATREWPFGKPLAAGD